jgi:MSHA biogenesis protein MshN
MTTPATAPAHYGYKKLKARLLLQAHQSAEAVALLEHMAPTVTGDPEYHDLLATGLLAEQDYERAVHTYRSLLQQDESMGRWWYGLAASLDAMGRGPEAGLAYEQALQRTDLSGGLRQNSQQRLAALRQN